MNNLYQNGEETNTAIQGNIKSSSTFIKRTHFFKCYEYFGVIIFLWDSNIDDGTNHGNNIFVASVFKGKEMNFLSFAIDIGGGGDLQL